MKENKEKKEEMKRKEMKEHIKNTHNDGISLSRRGHDDTPPLALIL